MNNTGGLNASEMQTAINILNAVCEDVRDCIGDVDEKQVIDELRVGLILSFKPYLMVTGDGYKEMHDLIFSSSIRTDYVFNVYASFVARWADSDNDLNNLINNIARGASIGISSSERTAETFGFPPAIADRLSDREDVHTLLRTNGWLLVLVMMSLFGKIDVKQKKAAKQ